MMSEMTQLNGTAISSILRGFPGSSDGKVFAYNVGDPGLISGSGRSLEKDLATHSTTLAWKIHGQRRLGYSLWGHKDSNMTDLS